MYRVSLFAATTFTIKKTKTKWKKKTTENTLEQKSKNNNQEKQKHNLFICCNFIGLLVFCCFSQSFDFHLCEDGVFGQTGGPETLENLSIRILEFSWKIERFNISKIQKIKYSNVLGSFCERSQQ